MGLRKGSAPNSDLDIELFQCFPAFLRNIIARKPALTDLFEPTLSFTIQEKGSLHNIRVNGSQGLELQFIQTITES